MQGPCSRRKTAAALKRFCSNGSGGRQHASAQKVKAGAAVHGALHQFKAIDLAFDLALTPGEPEGCQNGVVIALQAPGKGFEITGGALLDLFKPSWKILRPPLPDHGNQIPPEVPYGWETRNPSAKFSNEGIGTVAISRLTRLPQFQEPKADLAGRGNPRPRVSKALLWKRRYGKTPRADRLPHNALGTLKALR